MTLERYAQLMQLLEPRRALKVVAVTGYLRSERQRDHVRSQMSLGNCRMRGCRSAQPSTAAAPLLAPVDAKAESGPGQAQARCWCLRAPNVFRLVTRTANLSGRTRMFYLSAIEGLATTQNLVRDRRHRNAGGFWLLLHAILTPFMVGCCWRNGDR